MPARKPATPGKCRTTNNEYSCPEYPSLTDGPDTANPEKFWVCGITCIWLGNGFVYLAFIMGNSHPS